MTEARQLRVVAGAGAEPPLAAPELVLMRELFELLDELDREQRARGDEFRNETAPDERR